jgi:hypothetical protein
MIHYAERDDSIHTHEEDDRQPDEDKNAREGVAKSSNDALVGNDRDRPRLRTQRLTILFCLWFQKRSACSDKCWKREVDGKCNAMIIRLNT